MANSQFLSFADAGLKTGNGFVIVPVYEKEILDLTEKRGYLLRRMQTKPATGNPTQYFEKKAATATAAFQDPHALKVTTKYNVTRVAKAAFIKAITNEIEFTHFDREVANQQGLYNGLTTEDIRAMVTDLLMLQDAKVWTGNDTSLSESTTNEYVGLLTQITNTADVPDGTLICDYIRTKVAELAAKTDYDVRPSLIVVNPLTYDLIEQEEQGRENTVKGYEVEITAGIKVRGVMTCMGVLPIAPDPYLPIQDGTAGDSGKKIHNIAILSENLLTRYYVGSPVPRIFGFGLQDESLNEKFMVLQYDCIVAKGAEYAHLILKKKVTAA